MSTDSKQIPTVTLTTLFETNNAYHVQPEDKGSEHNLLSITTNTTTSESKVVVAALQPGFFVVNNQGQEPKKFPFVNKETVSTYTENGTFSTEYPVERTSDLQQAAVVSAVQSTDGKTMSLSYQQPTIFNQKDACTDEPLQVVPNPISIAVLDASTGETLGHLTYPPLDSKQEEVALLKGHRVVQQGNTTFTIDAYMTMPASAFINNSPSIIKTNSRITVNVMDKDLLSRNKTLLDAPQLLLKNFGAVTQIAVMPRNDGRWDLAVMGYARGNMQLQILVVQDVLSQQGVINVHQYNPAVSIINFERKYTYDNSNPDNRIVQVRLNGDRYLALATQNQFSCDQNEHPISLINIDELQARTQVNTTPLTLGDKNSGVTQIGLSSSDTNDCFGLHALTVPNSGTESLAISSIANWNPLADRDRIYVVEALPDSIVKGTVNEMNIQDTTAFIIANEGNDDNAKDCSDMSLELKGSSPFIPTNNTLLASRCASGGENDRVLVINYDEARKLAFENATDTNYLDTDYTDYFDTDSTGRYDSDSIGMDEIVAQKEQRNTWLSAGLMGMSSVLSSATVVAQGLLGETPPPTAIGTDNNPIYEINCSESNEFPVALAVGLGVAAVATVAAVGFFAVRKCIGGSSAQNANPDPENAQTEVMRLLN